jgi:hypothetical protein
MKTRPVLAAVILINALLTSSFISIHIGEQLFQPVVPETLNLLVKPIQQRKITSCGEAVITMAYNYTYPQTPIDELDVIEFAIRNKYYIDNRPPFTSPLHMVKIAEFYTTGFEKRSARQIRSGTVMDEEQGLQLLVNALQNNQPVIIDVLTNLNNRFSGAHFVLVTGVSMDSKDDKGAVISYNNPLTARSESAFWSGKQGVWNAWQNNGDPGGAGWWLVILH